MSKKQVKTPLIYALEPRLLFDGDLGADIASSIVYRDGNNGTDRQAEAPAVAPENQRENPRENITFEFHSARSAIVFIDGALEDTQTLIDAVPANAEVHILNGDSDGFEQISEILEHYDRVDEIHIFGHGMAGEARLGTASLSLETLTTHSDTLAVLKNTLTEDGDILLYGCNIASGDEGEAFIEELAELTAADIAASDDITGAGGDWELEVATGAIEAQIIKAVHYSEDMALTDVGTGSIPNISGVTKINNLTTAVIDEDMSSPNVSNANSAGTSDPIGRAGADAGGYYDDNKFYVLLEQENLTLNNASTVIGDLPITGNMTGSTLAQGDNGFLESPVNQTIGAPNTAINSYLVFLNYNNKNTSNRSDQVAQIVFDEEILGIFFATENTWDDDDFSSDTADYHILDDSVSSDASSDGKNLGRNFENTVFIADIHYDELTTTDRNGVNIPTNVNGKNVTNNGHDFITVGDYQTANDNRFMQLGAENKNAGDFIRVITAYSPANSAPTASDETVYINERNLYQGDGDRTPANTSKVFAVSDFASFSDPEDSAFSNLKITSLETDGDLQYSADGSSWADVTENQIISHTDINNGRLRFMPDRNAENDVSFGFQLSDSAGVYSAEQTMTISVNAAPTAANYVEGGSGIDAGATDTGNVKDIGIADSDDTDAVLDLTGLIAGDEFSNWENSRADFITDGTGIGTNVVGLYGTLQMASNGDFTYTANSTNNIAAGETAQDHFTYTVRDDETNAGSFAYDVGQISFRVNASNHAPVAADDTINATSGTDEEGNVLDNDSDPDGTTPIVSAIATGGGTAGTVGTALPGTYGTLTLTETGGYTYVVDADNADVLALGADDDPLTETFTYTITDGTDTDTATITVNVSGVNDPPTANDDTINATSGTDEEGNVLNNDSDPDGTTPTVSAIETGSSVGSGTAGTVGDALPGTYGSLTLNESGGYTYVVDADNADVLALGDGDDLLTETFTYTITDGTALGGTDTATITVNVSGVDDQPVAVDDTDEATPEADATGNVITNDNDPDGDALTLWRGRYVIEGGSSNFTIGSPYTPPQQPYGSLTLNSDGSYSYVVNPDNAAVLARSADDDPLTVTFHYDITQNDPSVLSDNAHARLIIDVYGVNDAPNAADNTVTTNEDEAHTFAASEFNFADVDSDSLDHVTIATLPATGTLTLSGTAVEAGDDIAANQIENLVYTPVANGNGDPYTSFTFTVNDGTADSASSYTMTVDVTPVNDAPTAADDSGNVIVGTEFSGNVVSANMSGQDTDIDASDTLIISALGSTNIANTEGAAATATGTYGTLVLGRDGSVTYNADQAAANELAFGDDAVTDTFTYTVSDGNGGTDTAQISFSVTAPDPGNAAPTAANNTVTTNEDEAHTFAASEFNFADVDSDSLDHVTIATLPATGTLTLSGTAVEAGDDIAANQIANLVYTPVANGNGDPYTTFTFTVNDGTADSASSYTMTVDVTPVNDVTARDDFAVVEEGTTLIVTNGANEATENYDNRFTSDNATIDISFNGNPNELVDRIDFNANGSKMFLNRGWHSQYETYNLSTPFDITTSSFSTIDSFEGHDGNTALGGLKFNADGSKVFMSSYNEDRIVQYDLSTNYSLNEAHRTFNSAISTLTFGNDGTPADIVFNSGGTKLFYLGNSTYKIYEITLGAAYDLSASITQPLKSFDLIDQKPENGAFSGLAISPDGRKVFVTDRANQLHEYWLHTAYDIETAVHMGSVNLANNVITDPASVRFNNDGTRIYFVHNVGNSSTNVLQRDLSTPFAVKGPLGWKTGDVLDTSRSQNQDDNADTVVSVRLGSIEGDGDSGTIGSSLDGTYGSLQLYENGSYQYAASSAISGLGAGEIVYDQFNYTARQTATGDTDHAVLTIAVEGKNDAPVASPITASKTENDSSFVTSLIAGQTDPDGDTLSVSETPSITAVDGNGTSYTLPANTATVSGNNLTVDPTKLNGLDDGESVVITVTYNVSDGTETTQNTATITVTGINEGPSAVDDTIEATSGIQASGMFTPVLLNDSDPEGDPLTITAFETGSSVGNGNPGTVGSTLAGTYGTLALYSDGVYAYDVNADHPDVLALGPDDAPLTETFTYTITDGISTDTATITVNVSGVNDAPTQTGRSGGISGSSNVLGVTELPDQYSGGSGSENNYTHTTSMYINLVDVDGDTLTVSKTFDSYNVSPNQNYARHSGAPYGDLTATIQETTSNDGGEWRVNLTYTVEDSDLDILADGEVVNQLYTISVADGTDSYSTQVRVQLSGQLDIYVEDDFATVNEGASISVNAGETPELADAKFTSANSPLIIDTFYDGHVTVGGHGKFFEGISFNNDGTKMYLSDNTSVNTFASKLVHNQYTLSTPYDISTATPDNKRLEGSSGGVQPFGVLEFNNDGTKAFNIDRRHVSQNSDNHIVEFSLTSPYNIDTATQVKETNFYNVADFAFNQDGTKFFYLAAGWHNNAASPHDSRLFQYDLGTPYDLDTATNSVSSNWGSGDVLILPEAIAYSSSFELSPDGHKLFVSSESGENEIYTVHEYFLTTAFDISTASKLGSVEYPAVSDTTNNAAGMIKFSNDGNKIYFLNRSIDNTYTNTTYEEVHEYDAQVPFSQFYQVDGHSGDVTNNDRGTSNQIISVRKGSIKGSGDEGTLGQSFDGAYGALTLHADGSYTYVANSDIDGLDDNEVVYDQFNYTVQDASGDSDIGVITITINGINSNTPPTVETAAVDPGISEAVDASNQVLTSTNNTIIFADDTDTSLTITAETSSTVTASNGVTLSTALQNALAAAITLNDNGDNTADWTLNADGLDLDFLDIGDSITIENVVTATDDDGETVTDTITVTITGTNDAPIAIDDTGNVEVGTEFSGNVLTASMGGEDAELDAGDSFQVDRLTGFGTAQVISNTPGSSATAVGTYGTITLGEDGSVTYNADQAAAIALGSGQPSVSETFNYRISDTDGETGTGTITFTISGINDAPEVIDDNDTPDDTSDDVANAASISTPEDTDRTINAADLNFTDIDAGDTLDSITIATLPDNGTLLVGGTILTADNLAELGANISATQLSDNELVFRPNEDESGDNYASFTYTVSDGEASSPIATMTVDVTPVDPDNVAPTAADKTLMVYEDATLIFSRDQFNFSDNNDAIDDALHHVTIVTVPPAGKLTLSGAPVQPNDEIPVGQIENLAFKPDDDANGDAYASFTFTVNDGQLDSISDYTMTIDVLPENDAPQVIDDNDTSDDTSDDVANAASISTPEDTDRTINAADLNFTDIDEGDTLDSLTIVTLPDSGTLLVGGTVLTADNLATLGAGISKTQLDNGELVFHPVDDENGSPYTSFTYTVSDGEASSPAATMTVDVTPENDAPQVIDDNNTSNDTSDDVANAASISTPEDTDRTINAADLNFTDIDAGDTLDSITIATLPESGTLLVGGTVLTAENLAELGANISATQLSDNELVFRPDEDESGDNYASFTYTVSDGEASSPIATMTVDVAPENDPPEVVAITDSKTENDNAFNTDLLAGQTDPESDTLSVASPEITIIDGDDTPITLPAGAATVTGNELRVDPTLFNDLDDGESVEITLTYDVSDSRETTQNTATITITGINDTPTINPLSNENTKTDADYAFDLLQGAFDVDGDTLSVVNGSVEFVYTNESGQQIELPVGAATINGNNVEISPSIFSTLGADDQVTIALTYDITDGDETASNTATITISGANTPPQIIDDNDTTDETGDDQTGVADVRTDEDTALTFAAENFNFSDQDENDTLSHITILTVPENGIMRLGENIIEAGDVVQADQIGNLVFTPDENDNGDNYASFQYTVNDGIADSATGTMTIHVDEANDPPTGADRNLELNGDDEIPLSLSNFIFDDIDEGDNLDKIIIVEAPTEGTLYLNNTPVQDDREIPVNRINQLSYKPGDNATGQNYDSFTFRVNDGEANSVDSYTMNIGVNAKPEANDGTLTVAENQPKDGSLSATDPEGGNVTYRITTQPRHGTLELINGGPDYIYKPDPYYYGPDSFKFKANDQTLESEEAVVDITVNPANTDPHSWTIAPGTIMVEGKVKAIHVSNFFGDVDAFDPSKRGFNDSVAKLYSDSTEQGNRFPDRAKFSDIPLEGKLTFDVDASTLPPGLTFDGTKISGRPQVAGVFPIRMTATDGLGRTAESIYTLFVGMPVMDTVVEKPTSDPETRQEDKPDEKTPDLNDHDLPKVLKVNPKRDVTIPMSEVFNSETTMSEAPIGDMGDSAGLAADGWMNTPVSSEQDVSGNIRVVDLKVEGEEIAVQIADEAADPAETFKGEMADGSKLPDWVKVDANTGLTTAEPPKGAEAIEMRIIAEDSSGNERAIDLVLNPEALRDDKGNAQGQTREERREARQERREARQAERQARIEAREERRAERAEKRATREFTRPNTDVSVLSDGRVKFAEGLTAAGEGSLRLMRMVTAPEAVTIEITDAARLETTRYEIQQKDGSPVPDWVQVNEATGELIIEAPQNAGMLELTLLAVDGGTQRSIELEVNFDEMAEEEDNSQKTLEATEEIEPGEARDPQAEPVGAFVPLDDQIDNALTNNNYGQELQTAMQSRV